MESVVEEALASPGLPEMVAHLQERLAEERVRRQRLYEDVSEDAKAAFIDGRETRRAILA